MLVFRVHHSITVVWQKIPVLTRFCLECLYVLPLDIFITFCLLGKWGGICCFLENMFGCPSVNGSVLQKDPTQTSFGLVSTWRIIPVKWLITKGDRMSPRATFPFQIMGVTNYLLSWMILQLPDVVRFNPVQLKARFSKKHLVIMLRLIELSFWQFVLFFFGRKAKTRFKKAPSTQVRVQNHEHKKGKTKHAASPKKVLFSLFPVVKTHVTRWNPGSKIASKHPSTVEHLEKVG